MSRKPKRQRKPKSTRRAVAELRALLLRVWFVKNWFTIFIMITTLLIVAILSGLFPAEVPVIGTASNAIKTKIQNFTSLNNEEYFSLFGSASGIFYIFFGLGYTSNKIKRVNYSMLNKDELTKILSPARLTINQKGKIIRAEKHLGVDIDGDNKIGETPVELKENTNVIEDVVNTVSELVTILSIDKDDLEQIEKKPEEEPVKVVQKKPSGRSNKVIW